MLSMAQIDSFIYTAIGRLSREAASSRSQFYVDLRSMQQRITKNLVADCMDLCARRGLTAERVGDGLNITVDLDTCFFNPQQADAYNVALAYTRHIHGNN